MGTYAHTIRKLEPGTLPRRFLILSAAPVVSRIGGNAPLFREQLRLGVISYLHRDAGNNWSHREDVYDSSESLLSLIDRHGSRREVTWIVAHGLAYHLAVSGLVRRMVDGGISVEGYHLTGRHMTARLRINGKVYHCVDSANYADRPWEWVCQATNTTIAKPFADSDTDSAALDKARLETATVRELVIQLCELMMEHGGGSWGWSIGSLAWMSWRRGLITTPIHVHECEEAHELERAAYCGARQECMYIGSVVSDIHCLDFNGMYGFTMLDRLPTNLMSIQRGQSTPFIKGMISECYCCIAECEVNARLSDYPYLICPSKSEPSSEPPSMPAYMVARAQQKRVWGRGKFTTTIATPELLRAIERDELVSIKRIAWYESDYPLKKYVQHWANLRTIYRTTSRLLKEHLCKRLCAVMHGKFGQWDSEWVNDPTCSPANPIGHWMHYDVDTKTHSLYRALGNKAQRYRVKGEWKHSFVALSAHVTSAARVLVDTACDIAGQRQVYYVDNDALHVSLQGYRSLFEAEMIDPHALGRLKLEGSYHGGAYRGIRDYQLGNNTRGRGEDSRSVTVTQTQTGADTGADIPRTADTSAFGNIQLSALHSESPVHQFLKPGVNGWSSGVSVPVNRRNRYGGRVSSDGWVRPLILPILHPLPEQGRMYDDSES